MGSFATSVHVKSENADAVVAAIRELLIEDGWRPTERAIEPQDVWGDAAGVRGVHVSAARDGWVSLLDSDLAASQALVAELAGRLTAPALGLSLRVEPRLAAQKLRTSFTYWEGAVRLTGTRGGRDVSGNGYVELTGYARSMQDVF